MSRSRAARPDGRRGGGPAGGHLRPRGRWPARWAAVLAAAVFAGSGCGVPSNSDVVGEGRGENAAPAFGDDGTSEPDGRSATTDPLLFLQNLLAAAAGEPKKAVARVRDFLAPELRDAWNPGAAVQVIRIQGEPIVDQSALGYNVQVSAAVLGDLGEDGRFQPRPARTQTYAFTFADNVDRQTGLFVTEAPSVVLLSDQALQRYFELQAIYFWSIDHKVLVPDLRYLPRRDVPGAQRATLIIDWLLRGPSPWLRAAVDPSPFGAKRVGKVPVPTNGMFKVVLSEVSNVGNDDEVARLATQLRWSLRTGSAGDPDLDLRIDQLTKSFTDEGYLDANPAYRNGRDPIRFCVLGGQVRLLGSAPSGISTPQVPPQWNRQVLKAALAGDAAQPLVALVRQGPRGRPVLDVGGGAGPLEALQRLALGATEVSQPVWLPGGGDTGLVAVGGVLNTFRATGGTLRPVADAPSDIKAFAVPPDGHRLAYVAGGRLYVAPLLNAGGTLTVGTPRQEVPTTLTGLTGVGWSQQDWLVVAGRQADDLVALHDITVDGAAQATPRGGQFGTQPVDHLVASTDDPVNGRGAGQVMYVANGLAYELFSQQRPLSAADIAGATPSPGAGRTAEAGNPDVPFFLD